MQLILLSAEEKQAYKEEIVSILRTGDRDFVPPLSARFARGGLFVCLGLRP